jgi:hypothetical protein
MAEEVALTAEAERAIRRYLVQLAIVGATAFGLLNVWSLLTFVPNLAAERVTESETIKKVREEALVSGGALKETVRRAREELAAAEKTLSELSLQVQALKVTDPAKLAAQAAALQSLGDTTKLLDAIVAMRLDIPTGTQVTKQNPLGFTGADTLSECPSGQVVVGVGSGRNQDLRIRCGVVEFKK